MNIYEKKITAFIKLIVKKKKKLKAAKAHKNQEMNNNKFSDNAIFKCICKRDEYEEREGFGICYWKNGNVFKGYYEEDKINGYGFLKVKGGDSYLGQFKDNKLNGFGIYTYHNGTIYTGIWKDECQTGIGIEIWKIKLGKC